MRVRSGWHWQCSGARPGRQILPDSGPITHPQVYLSPAFQVSWWHLSSHSWVCMSFQWFPSPQLPEMPRAQPPEHSSSVRVASLVDAGTVSSCSPAEPTGPLKLTLPAGFPTNSPLPVPVSSDFPGVFPSKLHPWSSIPRSAFEGT